MQERFAAEPVALQDSFEAAPHTRIAHAIILYAIRGHASDLLIEPQKKGLRITCHVFRQLREMTPLPPNLIEPVTAYVKTMAGVDPKPSRTSQQGEMWVIADGVQYHLMLITTPTEFGESLALQLPA